MDIESFIHDNVSLSVLTWRAPKTLSHTLKSISPIQNLFKNRFVLCQESDPDEIRLSEHFGLQPYEVPKNLGIQEGLAKCADIAPTRYVLILENDCNLKYPDCARDTIFESVRALRNNLVDVVKLGTIQTGNSQRYVRFWGSSYKPRRTWKAVLRPLEARACLGGSIYMSDFPDQGSDDVKRISPHLFVTESRFMGWTNRAFLIERNFFLNTIITFARKNPAPGKVNGLPDLEKEINCFQNRSWWRRQPFRIGLTRPGLFDHHRLDRNIDDEKY